MQDRRVLVTGASGFVGRHLLVRLVAEGFSVVAQHRSALSDDLRARFGDRIAWRQADIVADDLAPLAAGVDVAFHLAAHATVSESPEQIALLRRVNVLGTQRLAAACKAAGVRHFVFVSSIAACESGALEITETNGVPCSSYGKSKLAAEAAVLALAATAFDITILRPTALFGEQHLGSLYELVRVIDQGRMVIFGDGSNCTNFYYIADFIDVLLTVQADARARGQTFIASDAPCTVQALVCHIQTELGVRRRVHHVPRALGFAAGQVFDLLAAVTRRPMPLSVRRVRAMTRDVRYRATSLERTLGSQPRHGLVQGVRNTIAWFRQADLL
jgi:nucleoside-diphosphate-sugar epimerase